MCEYLITIFWKKKVETKQILNEISILSIYYDSISKK